jgi:hypothetical protein
MPITIMRDGNAEEVLSYLTQGKFDFQLTSSNYTTRVNSELVNRTFVQTIQSNKTFAAFAKLKKDLKAFTVPNISVEQVRYFEHDFKKDFYHPEVINIDLKSAYARIFFNDKMITDKTFKYISKLKKQERLAAVGMLASRKKVFQFKDGKPVSYEENISELSGFFFYSVKRIQEIMSELKRICDEKYLFTWVDGIYLIPDEQTIKNCVQYLESIKFPFSTDTLQNFKISILEKNTYVTFQKKGISKRFYLPSISSEFKKVTMEAIILVNQNKKQNEKSKIKNPR